MCSKLQQSVKMYEYFSKLYMKLFFSISGFSGPRKSSTCLRAGRKTFKKVLIMQGFSIVKMGNLLRQMCLSTDFLVHCKHDFVFFDVRFLSSSKRCSFQNASIKAGGSQGSVLAQGPSSSLSKQQPVTAGWFFLLLMNLVWYSQIG